MEVAWNALLGLHPHRVHRIAEASQPGSLRRETAELARSMGMSEEAGGRAAIVATELGTNLVKHARQGGEVLLRRLALNEVGGVELLSVDRGPGMSNPARMLEDGVSTAGSPGTGLGAIKRLSDEFALYSSPGVGTVILSRIWGPHGAERSRRLRMEWGAVHLPKPGEDVCGDGWAILLDQDRALVMVADGLGHGPGAATAASEAVRAFTEEPSPSAEAAVRKLHQRLRHTRGAAAAVADVRLAEGSLAYAAVGNIFSRIVSAEAKTQNLVSMNGVVGYEARKIQAFGYPWRRDSMLVMNSDGLTSSWDLCAYPGLKNQHPALVAAIAYRDYGRGGDDLTVVAVRSPLRSEA